MQCHLCHQIRYSKEWRPCQWQAYSPVCNEFAGCRDCASRQSCPQPAVKVTDDFIQHLRQFVPQKAGRLCMSRWVLKWEGALDFDDRKAMSRHGAIRCRVPLDPVHFTGLDGRTYFDPMNHIYARVIWLFVMRGP